MSVDFYREEGELGYLANYSNYGFTVDGVYYPTAEHFYQASKFDNPEIIQKILSCKTAREAASVGRDRNNKRIDHFNDIKLNKMYQAVYEKFQQNPDIRKKLIETGDEEIREMTDQESYWGVGPQLDGENHMGEILMRVREELKNQ